MPNERTNRMIDDGVAGAERVQLQAAEALEEAARKLRSADVAAQGEDIRRILEDVESRIHQTRTAVEAGCERCDTGFHRSVGTVETLISAHPLPAVLVAAVLGTLTGMLISRARD